MSAAISEDEESTRQDGGAGGEDERDAQGHH
jgi:hypothetical protein